MKRFFGRLLAIAVTSAFFISFAAPAGAVCHIVGFDKQNYPVNENAGSVTITITRNIVGPGCQGFIEYTTDNDSAKAPADYATTSGRHDFTVPTEASFSFTVPIKDDKDFEGEERFKVTFTGNNNGPSAGSATVTIQDNDPAPAQSPGGTSTRTSPTPSPTATVSPTLEATAGSPLPLEASPTESPEAEVEAAAEEDGGTPIGLIIAAVAGILAVAGGAFWLLRRRQA